MHPNYMAHHKVGFHAKAEMLVSASARYMLGGYIGTSAQVVTDLPTALNIQRRGLGRDNKPASGQFDCKGLVDRLCILRGSIYPNRDCRAPAITAGFLKLS